MYVPQLLPCFTACMFRPVRLLHPLTLHPLVPRLSRLSALTNSCVSISEQDEQHNQKQETVSFGRKETSVLCSADMANPRPNADRVAIRRLPLPLAGDDLLPMQIADGGDLLPVQIGVVHSKEDDDA